MTKQVFSFTILISISLCLWTGKVFGQQFPEKPTARFGKGTISDIAYSPDGKVLAVAGSQLWLYDTSNLTEIAPLMGHTDIVKAVTFSPDGRLLASASRDHTVRLWDVFSHQQIGEFGHNHPVPSIAISPDGSLLASASDKSIVLWSVETQQQVGLLEGHLDTVNALDIGPDGRFLASGSNDGTVGLWDLETQQLAAELMHLAGSPIRNVSSVDFSPDGKLLASAGGAHPGGVVLWNVEAQQQVGSFEFFYGKDLVAFSPDGKLLASVEAVDDFANDFIIELWDVQTQQQVGLLEHAGFVNSLSFSPDGKTLASRSHDNTVRLWDVASQQQVGLLKEAGLSFAFNPNGKILASGSFVAGDGFAQGVVKLWDIQTQQLVGELEGDREAVSSIAISLDGKWLASGRSDGTILLWAIGSDVVSVEPKGKQFITLGDLKHTMLLQNYPNPFNPETWIPFVLGEAADVEIRIYSANSNQARTLHLGQKEIGMGQTTPEKQSQAASTFTNCVQGRRLLCEKQCC